MTWQPVTYDPELNQIYVDDRQSAAGHRAQEPRRATISSPASIVALNADTGQDGVVLPVVAARHARLGFDADGRCCSTAPINGQPRKLVAQAARNGHFFVLDRTNGKAIVSSEYVKTNWAHGLRREGPADSESGEDAADRRRARDARIRAARPTGRRRASVRRRGCSTSARTRAFSVYYIYDPGDNPQGWGGTDRGGWCGVDAAGDRLQDRQDQLEPQVGRRLARRACSAPPAICCSAAARQPISSR